jgi:S1-C subfamily serine protease
MYQGKIMKKLFVSAIATATICFSSGCGTYSTGIVQIGPGLYMVGGRGAITEYSGASVKAGLYQEASKYCADKGRVMLSVNSTGQDGTLSTYATAEIQFRCLVPTDPQVPTYPRGSTPNEDEILISTENLFTKDISENIDHILKSTVTIRTGTGHGSGFLIDESGLIITNAHVVGNSKKVTVVFNSGIEVNGRVLRINKYRDVALLKIDVGGLKTLPISHNSLNLAEEVFAIGTPLKEGLKSTITKGIVSASRIQEDTGLKYIQSDVAIQSGNSGGPLLDNKGNVAGISVAGYGVKGFSSGVNLFIPIMDGLHWLNIKVDPDNN